ncbi:MAG: hypothetical protein HUJ99_05155, partial [Bacteroidaceae bacterium]|nr:hypothetical protein [Bacteroidaceae bacterium]
VLPGEQFASHTQDIILTSTAVAIVSFANLVNIMVHIVGMVKKISEDNYSNTEDFPIDFAKAALLGSLVLCLFTLPTLLIPNDTLLSIGILVFSIGNVAFLIGCLHPHRNLAAEANKLKKEKTEEKAAKESMEAEPGKDSLIIQALRPRIEKVFTEDKIYLNPNLTISDVARAIGSNRTYTSMVFRAEFGSFLIYVNNMRIRHALQLQQKHPGWKQVELYQSSGFNNRSSYKKWLAYYLNKNKNHG